MIRRSAPGLGAGESIVFIVSGGPLEDLLYLRRRLREANPAEVVCADGGARHMLALGMTPQTVIGDMDSLSAAQFEDLQAKGCRVLKHPARKDETDTELALHYAMALKPDEIEIHGALGGRIDHTLANISLLVCAARAGVRTRIVDATMEMFVISEACEMRGRSGEIVSLFPMTTEVRGLTLKGFEYPLEEASMELGKPYGISNRMLHGRGTVTLSSGYLLIVRTYGREEENG
ncbi:MAG: thiamine diphosphokinase [Deltaproteobacteria bacterium]|nr:thiamine diphosphokinase [Deltaproteobacteria bacterium]